MCISTSNVAMIASICAIATLLFTFLVFFFTYKFVWGRLDRKIQKVLLGFNLEDGGKGLEWRLEVIGNKRVGFVFCWMPRAFGNGCLD